MMPGRWRSGWGLAGLALTLALGGCLVTTEPYRPVRIFDLGVPEATGCAGLRIGDFQVQGPYRAKMVRRLGEHELVVDEYHHWAQSPAALVQHCLRQAFSAASAARWRVDGEIIVFEADIPAGEAVFEVAYVLVDTAARDRVLAVDRRRYAVPMAAATADGLAAAMTRAVGLFAADLARELPAESSVGDGTEGQP